MVEIFATVINNKGLILRIYIFSQNNRKGQKTPGVKWTRDLNKYFTKNQILATGYFQIATEGLNTKMYNLTKSRNS